MKFRMNSLAHGLARMTSLSRRTVAVVAGFCLILVGVQVALAAGGALDRTFGANGIVLTQFGNDSTHALAGAMQSDGKIIAVGGTYSQDGSHIAMTRLLANGDLDGAFGVNGQVTTPVGFDDGRAVAIQPDDKILVTGSSNTFGLVRYTRDGVPDETFGATGVVTIAINNQTLSSALAVQPDGKILVAGRLSSTYAVARYLTNGDLDSSFGAAGVVTMTVSALSSGSASALALQNDGKILVGGNFYSSQEGNYSALVRHLSDGSLDPSFGNGGFTITPQAGDIRDLALQGDNKIIAMGSRVLRYLNDGSLDPAFGAQGISSSFRAMAVQADGRILLAGEAYLTQIFYGSPPKGFSLARLNEDGALDTTFGSRGQVVTAIPNDKNPYMGDLFIQPDGQVVVIGVADRSMVIARYANLVDLYLPTILKTSQPVNPTTSSAILLQRPAERAVGNVVGLLAAGLAVGLLLVVGLGLGLVQEGDRPTDE